MGLFTLGTFPADSLGAILDFCCGGDVLRLLQCGNRAFSATVTRVAREIDFVAKGFSKFPFVAFNLPHLRRLSVYLGEGVLELPLNLGGRPVLPMEPMPTLEKLRYRFAQSGSIFGSPSALSWYFPNLIDLSVELNMDHFEIGYFNQLPKTLRRLRIRMQSNPPSRPYVCVPFATINALSSHLERLSLEDFMIGEVDEDPSTAFDKSATCLTELRLTWLTNAELLLHLPSSLEEVDVEMDSESRHAMVPLRISSFPKNLRVFHGYLLSSSDVLVFDGVLPPRLELFTGNPNPRIESALTEVPKTLKHAAISASLYGPRLELLPPSITRLDTYEIGDRIDEVKSLPPNLQHLYWSVPGDKLTMSHFDLFPASLKTLHLSDPDTMFEVPPTTWARFGTLTSLDISWPMVGKESNLSLLPFLAYFHTNIPSTTPLPLNLARQLPTSLTELRVSVEGARDWTSPFLGISRLSLLNTLTVFPREPFKDAIPTFLKELSNSQTLKVLVVPMENSWDISFFSALPRSLQTIHFTSGFRDGIAHLRLTDQHFEALPKSLTNFTLPYFAGASNHFYQSVPPGIHSFYPSIEAYPGDYSADTQAYNKSSYWMGYHP